MKTIEEEIKQTKPFKSNWNRVIVYLLKLTNELQNDFNGLLKPFDITNQQYNILRILRGQKGKVISQLSLKERMIDSNSDISRLLDRLVKKGFVTKTVNEADRRQSDIIISEQGLETLTRIEEKTEINYRELPGMSEEEIGNLCDDIAKFREAFFASNGFASLDT